MCRSLHKKSIILDTMRTGSDWPVMSGNGKVPPSTNFGGFRVYQDFSGLPRQSLPTTLTGCYLRRQCSDSFIAYYSPRQRLPSTHTDGGMITALTERKL